MKCVIAFFFAALFAPAATLDVYVLDVEGGKAVLAVAPSGESLLFDAGWPGYNGRDTNRIVEAAKAAGLKQIDYLVISHYDIDHMGDVPLLVSSFPVKHIVDNGALRTSGKTLPIIHTKGLPSRRILEAEATRPLMGDGIGTSRSR